MISIIAFIFSVIISIVIVFFLVSLGEKKCPKCGDPMFRWSSARWDCENCGYKQGTGL